MKLLPKFIGFLKTFLLKIKHILQPVKISRTVWWLKKAAGAIYQGILT
jgi:hypothetical protein